MADESFNEQFALFHSMTNVQLRTELKRRGYSTSGNKKDLLAKLQLAINKDSETTTESSPIKSEKQPLGQTMENNGQAMESEVFVSKNDPEELKDRERLEDQSISTSLNNETSVESTSLVEENLLINEQKQINTSESLSSTEKIIEIKTYVKQRDIQKNPR